MPLNYKYVVDSMRSEELILFMKKRTIQVTLKTYYYIQFKINFN